MKKSTIPYAMALALTGGLFSLGLAAHHHDQGAHAGHGKHAGHGQQTESKETGAFAAANQRMMEQMHAQAPTGDADYDFVTGMIPHHQGAIDMAKVLLEGRSDETLRELAEAIVKAQDTEITQMRAWLESYGEAKPGMQAELVKAAYGRIDERMMTEMHAVDSGNLDKDFVMGMIPHHIAAVEMAYVLLAYSEDEMLTGLARDVISEQEREIALMRSWLAHAAH